MCKVKFQTWEELAERLRLYQRAVGILGGMNELDETLGIAAGSIELLRKEVPENRRKDVGGFGV